MRLLRRCRAHAELTMKGELKSDVNSGLILIDPKQQ